MNSIQAIELLHKITDSNTPQRRSLELLKQPETPSDSSWSFCLLSHFNEALDIKYTDIKDEETKTQKKAWTQGSLFSFKAEDVIFDTINAYDEWSEALKHIKLAIIIKSASPSGFANKNRISGSITFTFLSPNSNKSTLVRLFECTTTQDEFVSLLIKGPSDSVSQKISEAKDTLCMQ